MRHTVCTDGVEKLNSASVQQRGHFPDPLDRGAGTAAAPRCPCCTGAHGGREMPYSARQFIIALHQNSVIHKRRIEEVSAKEVAKVLWKSTNSEEYTLDSLSD